jgi:hypothetical protein
LDHAFSYSIHERTPLLVRKGFLERVKPPLMRHAVSVVTTGVDGVEDGGFDRSD